MVHLNRLDPSSVEDGRVYGDEHGGLAVPDHVHLVPYAEINKLGLFLSAFVF